MFFIFFFHDTATTEIYTLSLHDALPILPVQSLFDYLEGGDTLNEFLRQFPTVTREQATAALDFARQSLIQRARDRKSTRLNSSHLGISYAVFCLKKKK